MTTVAPPELVEYMIAKEMGRSLEEVRRMPLGDIEQLQEIILLQNKLKSKKHG